MSGGYAGNSAIPEANSGSPSQPKSPGKLSVGELKQKLKEVGVSYVGCTEKSELVQLWRKHQWDPPVPDGDLLSYDIGFHDSSDIGVPDGCHAYGIVVSEDRRKIQKSDAQYHLGCQCSKTFENEQRHVISLRLHGWKEVATPQDMLHGHPNPMMYIGLVLAKPQDRWKGAITDGVFFYLKGSSGDSGEAVIGYYDSTYNKREYRFEFNKEAWQEALCDDIIDVELIAHLGADRLEMRYKECCLCQLDVPGFVAQLKEANQWPVAFGCVLVTARQSVEIVPPLPPKALQVIDSPDKTCIEARNLAGDLIGTVPGKLSDFDDASLQAEFAPKIGGPVTLVRGDNS